MSSIRGPRQMLPARPQGSFAASAHALDHWLRTVASASPALTPRLNVELCSTPVCSSALITDIPGCSSQLHRAEFGPLHLLSPCRVVPCRVTSPHQTADLIPKSYFANLVALVA
ncbi:putative mitochondrial AAA ATPase [Metarhizium anisopliae]|nr:putative mitochondrial AAA ATPase [Metarhizium anisopliae]